MSFVKHAVIAAAGLGSRLGLGKPKALVEVFGAPLIHHQLEILKDVPDVRVVVGFEEHAVINTALQIRKDITFVRNPAFRSTTTLTSYALGAKNLSENTLFMDADIYFDMPSFTQFLTACTSHDILIGITKAKTVDAVFVHTNDRGEVLRFSRTEGSEYEWANLCWLPPAYCEQGAGAVFERFAADLPIPSCEIMSYEVDTPQDMETLLAHVKQPVSHLSEGGNPPKMSPSLGQEQGI